MLEQIRNFLQADPDIGQRLSAQISQTDKLIESGILDSFGVVSLIGFLEEAFSITVEPEEFIEDNFATLVAIAAYVQRKKAGAKVGA